MAWTAPATWTTGQVVTASDLNAQVRDNLNALSTHAHTGSAGDGAAFDQLNVRMIDEFLTHAAVTGALTDGRLGQLGWNLNGSASPVLAGLAGEANHPGIWQLKNNGNATGYVVLNLGAAATASFLPAAMFDLTFIVRLNNNDANTTMRFGLFSDPTANPPADGIYMEKLAADTAWYGVTRASSSQTRSTSPGNTSSSWVRLRVRRVDASTIGFTVDGGTERTNTANIPTAALSPALYLIGTANAAVKTFDVDFVSIDIRSLTR